MGENIVEQKLLGEVNHRRKTLLNDLQKKKDGAPPN
jgi:hypothetical protein